MAAGGPKIFSTLTLISTFTPYVKNNHPLLTSIPQELGKLDNSLAEQAKEVGFSQTCTEVQGPPDLDMLPTGAHPAAPLIRHADYHGVPIALSRGMDKEERDTSILYGTHTSACKEAEFTHT